MMKDKRPPLLVVEDSDEDFAVLDRIMKQHCDVSVMLTRCTDGDDALDYLYRQGPYAEMDVFTPGLIVLDLNLPGTDGREVLAQIKSDDRLKTIPVVVFTTSSSPSDIEICYRAGVNSYMLKRMNLEQLKVSVQLFFDYWFKAALLPSRAASSSAHFTV